MSLDKLELKRICSAWAIIALKPFLMLLVILLLFIIVTESSWNIDFIQKPMFIRLFIEFPYPKITLLFLFLYFFFFILFVKMYSKTSLIGSYIVNTKHDWISRNSHLKVPTPTKSNYNWIDVSISLIQLNM